MKNIGVVKDCFGCGVCTKVCGKHIIDIHLNEDGFYEPYITDPDKCVECGLCTSVCSFLADDIALKDTDVKAYASWSKDLSTRRKCSSGGVSFEVGRYLLSQGYEVCAVRYDAKENLAFHYIASTIEELEQSIGSKYIQSNSIEALAKLDRKKKYLVTGTPCQIDSLRRYIKKFHCEENFILMDIFCHGVPSKLMWDKYITEAKAKVGNIRSVSWRNKETGWHDSNAMAIEGVRGRVYSTFTQGDIFYKMFLSNSCLNKACYKDCRFKYLNSSADIRIGDMWGRTYSKNEDGINGVLTFTAIGYQILHEANLECIEHTVQEVGAGQMRQKAKCPPTRKYIINALKNNDMSLWAIYNKYQKPYKYLMIPVRVFNKIKRMLHAN